MIPEPTDSLPARVGQVVLPREHGGWSLVLEPLALGLIVAPSAAGAALGMAFLAVFFSRRPLKLVLGGGSDPRRSIAFGSIAVLAAIAAAGLLVAGMRAGPASLWPLLLAAPAAAAFAWWDSRGEGREAAAELAGATAFAIVPAALAAAAGWTSRPALALTAVMAGRSVPTVMTVRAYLRRNKGQPVPRTPALAASVLALAGCLVLCRMHLAPWTAGLMTALLLARAMALLIVTGPRIPASRVGLAEAVFGGILVLVVALSWSR